MRLIDADVIIKESTNILKWLMERQKLGIDTTPGELHDKWLDTIRKTPTAYDPNDVVERFKEVSYGRYGNNGMGGELVVNLDDVVDVVKDGGVNMAKHCKFYCQEGKNECCICCDKFGECGGCCEMDSYEYAEDCPNYVEDET